MIKELTREEFEKRFPEVSTYGIRFGEAVFLENGVIMHESEWNGEHYTIKEKDGTETSYEPIEEPDDIDDDGEVLQWKIIGYKIW